MSFPLWAVGLVIAGLAPFCVGLIIDAIDSIVRRRTLRAFELSEPKSHDEKRQSAARRTS